jgi:hypothetical protein
MHEPVIPGAEIKSSHDRVGYRPLHLLTNLSLTVEAFDDKFGNVARDLRCAGDAFQLLFHQ